MLLSDLSLTFGIDMILRLCQSLMVIAAWTYSWWQVAATVDMSTSVFALLEDLSKWVVVEKHNSQLQDYLATDYFVLPLNQPQ